MNKPWYAASAGRLLVDMHIPDWSDAFFRDFSAERYADCRVEAGVDTVEIYAGSCLGLCNWPTRTGYRHRISGNIDMLGAVVAACRTRNLKIVIYLNVWSRKAYDEHPEWRMIHHDGLGSVEREKGRFGLCCPNTGFQAYFLALLDELNAGYACSGLWIDMIGWFGHICYCPGCQKRFRDETGYDAIPRTIDWNDPVWNAFQECRERWLAEFAAAIRATIRKRTPERSLALQCSGIPLGWGGAITPDFLRQTDYLAADLYSDQYEQSFICKLFRAFSPHQPIEFMVPRCENLAHHTTGRSRISLEMRSYASLANQAAFSLIDAIDPAGTLDGNFYRMAGELNRNLAGYRSALNWHSEARADVGIYYDFTSMMNVHRSLPVAEFQQDVTGYLRMINLVRALQSRHLSVAFTGEPHLSQLSRYRVVILSEATHLDDTACAALTEYVRNGGRLYVSGSSSLYDRRDGRRNDFRLAELLGIRFTGRMFPAGYYLKDTEAPLPVVSDWPQPEIAVAADDVQVLGSVVAPYSNAAEQHRFGSAISNPPERDTGCPALTARPFGRGHVVYCAALLENEPYDCHREYVAGRIEAMVADDRLIATDAPATVEFTVFAQPDLNRLVVSLLNFTTELPPPVLREFTVTLQLAATERIVRISRLPDGGGVPFHQRDTKVSFSIPELDKFTVLTINLEAR